MTNKRTTLSIIIPTFRAGTTLARALTSIVAQRYKDFEVLIMDGGSTDGTVQIAETFAGEWKNIRFFSAPDKGIYDAMNKGLELAAGEWIYFLGGDDELFDDRVLETIFTGDDAATADVLYGQVLLTEKNTLYLGEFDAEKLVFRNISHQAIFTRRRVFERYGKFDLKYKICADHIFNVKWFFDPSVKRKFVDVVVAKFGQEGISSQKDDVDKVKDLPGLVKQYGGTALYLRFYYLRPVVMWTRKKIRLCKKLLSRFVPITT